MPPLFCSSQNWNFLLFLNTIQNVRMKPTKTCSAWGDQRQPGHVSQQAVLTPYWGMLAAPHPNESSILGNQRAGIRCLHPLTTWPCRTDMSEVPRALQC